MSAVVMAVALVVGFGAFALSLRHRLALLRSGAPVGEPLGPLGPRIARVVRQALLQERMRHDAVAGWAHLVVFAGFVALLARTLVLWGRAFDPAFHLWVLAPSTWLGQGYALVKDLAALGVLGAVGVFAWLRVVRRPRRLTLSSEALVILGIIAAMMVADLAYDGAMIVLADVSRDACRGPVSAEWCASAARVVAPLAADVSHGAAGSAWEPGGAIFASMLAALPAPMLVAIANGGYWAHALLVLVFLQLLPYSKHFHVVTAVPNLFLGPALPDGRLRPLADSSAALLATVEAATNLTDLHQAPIGAARLEHLSWKDQLDLVTCTECGRCSDRCPATRTGKVLSPKHLTLALRDSLTSAGPELFARAAARPTLGALRDGSAQSVTGEAAADTEAADLVPQVVDPAALWACTTCGACEEACPVGIGYVGKIVDLRRHLVTIRGEHLPSELSRPFDGMESNGNPWNLPRLDRSAWAAGLDVPRAAERPTAEVLFWVGCAPSYDDRARRAARAFVRLLRAAEVDFAILGDEETCTGDAARRSGNEYLFLSLAEQNVATIERYRALGGARRIVAICPHCTNSLSKDYQVLGASWPVQHHTQFLLELVRQGRLRLDANVDERVTFHDPCYLARHAGDAESPRALLERVPGLALVEAAEHGARAMCCGAGGGQMWLEERGEQRVNQRRSLQLLETRPTAVAVACPFCNTMLSDGIAGLESQVPTRDVAELLAQAAGLPTD